MAIVVEEELIDGLTLDEWCDMIPVGVEKMTDAEKAAAHREVDIRVAAIRKERFGEKPWQAGVYGKQGEYPAYTGDGSLTLAEPQAAYGPTGTPEQDAILEETEAYRKAGGRFMSVNEFFAGLDAAIDGVKNARV